MNISTAFSFAALRTPVMVPPARPAAYASSIDGYLTLSGALNVRDPSLNHECSKLYTVQNLVNVKVEKWNYHAFMISENLKIVKQIQMINRKPKGKLLAKIKAWPSYLRTVNSVWPGHCVKNGQPHVRPS